MDKGIQSKEISSNPFCKLIKPKKKIYAAWFLVQSHYAVLTTLRMCLLGARIINVLKEEASTWFMHIC